MNQDSLTVSPPESHAVGQLRRLQRVTDAALGRLSAEQLLDELLTRVREELGVDTAAVLLLDAAKDELVARAAKGLEEEVEEGVRIPVGGGFAGRIAAERRPITILEVDHSNVLNPILRRKGVRSLLGVPLVAEGSLLGVLHIGTLKQRAFGAEDVQLLQLVGDRVALALKVRLRDRDRVVADTFQRSLLPDPHPSIPGLALSSRFLPAPTGIEVGGDWYDAFTLPNGRLAVAVGDVAGRGLGAAAVMGQARNALRAYSLEGHPPAKVAQLLDDLVVHFGRGDMVTLVYGVIEPDLNALRYVVAGHMPPLLLDQHEARFLEFPGETDPPLGTGVAPMFHERLTPLQPGATILLYTDGLVEQRTESLSVGLERLRRIATDQVGGSQPTPARMLRNILNGLVAGREHVDDIAALLMQRQEGLSGDLRFEVPAEAQELPRARWTIRFWLSQADVPPGVRDDIVTAFGEACANVVEHAYGPAGGSIEVEAGFDDSAIHVNVNDRGRWRSGRHVRRGRGLSLMKALMDRLEVERGSEGTTVSMWKARATAR